MTTLMNASKSLLWMIHAGVDVSDVEWLERMAGSVELHLPSARARVEHIYKLALDGILSTPSPAMFIRTKLN